MKQLVVRFVREDAGQDLIEYMLLASFIAAGVITGATFLGSQLNGWVLGGRYLGVDPEGRVRIVDSTHTGERRQARRRTDDARRSGPRRTQR